MPKTSERQQTIKDLQLLIAFLSGEGKWDEVVEIAELLAHVEGSRFFGKRLARFHAKEFFLRTGLFANMHDDQFRTKFRTDRNSFNALCGLIQDHPIFSSNGNTCAQLPVPYQVAVAINRLGTYENAAGVLSLSTNFGISIGSVNNYTNRVVEAITDSCAHFLSWPDAEQRQEIRQVLAAEGFPGCVGFVDGSTLPLAWKRSLDGEVYFDRKKR
ncbi:hypothetical protein DFS34DRAFT_576914 [Phlyctochytrium arcticum]|nr:hypothetical protein DFS34DRAFT_576914 [Phlyctochytrium arcticum]